MDYDNRIKTRSIKAANVIICHLTQGYLNAKEDHINHLVLNLKSDPHLLELYGFCEIYLEQYILNFCKIFDHTGREKEIAVLFSISNKAQIGIFFGIRQLLWTPHPNGLYMVDCSTLVLYLLWLSPDFLR